MRNKQTPETDQGKSQLRAPVAALLFDPATRPALSDVLDLARRDRAFDVIQHDAVSGRGELLRDGMTFACAGLSPGAALPIDTALQLIDLPGDFVPADHAAVMLGAGPQLAGAGHLLPVARVLAALVLALGGLPRARAVAWLPARLAMSPAWFAEAVGRWLEGGPFPALALTALVRREDGFASQGLAYFVGQEFVFAGKDGILREVDARGAVRLTDWLIAHGPVDCAREVELAGFGPVLIEPDGQNGLRARSV